MPADIRTTDEGQQQKKEYKYFHLDAKLIDADRKTKQKAYYFHITDYGISSSAIILNNYHNARLMCAKTNDYL